jgi:hypothetical protein
VKALDIIDCNRRVLGTLSVDPDGRLRLEVLERGYHLTFDALMRQILRAPLPLRTYEPVILPGEASVEVRIRHVTPGDPDFLWAVRDHLERNSLGDLSVTGRIRDIPAPRAVDALQSNGKPT